LSSGFDFEVEVKQLQEIDDDVDGTNVLDKSGSTRRRSAARIRGDLWILIADKA
jgi:hypothetical protein